MTAQRNKGRFLIASGAVLILAALSLVLYNFYHETESKKAMDKALVRLEKEIPSQPQDNSSPFDVFDSPEGIESEAVGETPDEVLETEETVELDGKLYLGIITLPSLDQKFPVIKGWSYGDMNVAPCQYAGSRAGRDLIICGHNYAGFFDKLENLNSGDEVIFTDINGNNYYYEVSYTELISGWDSSSMFQGAREDWDLTLFTCTWSGYSRVTVRCVRK